MPSTPPPLTQARPPLTQARPPAPRVPRRPTSGTDAAVRRPRRRSPRPYPLLRAVLAAILVLAGAIVGALAVPQSAAAAEIGPGFQEHGKPLNHLGGYRTSDGTIAYCIEAGQPSPVGATTTDSGFTEQINGLDPATMLRLSVVLGRYGTTADPRTAAAVAMAVWSIADAERYAAAGGDERALRRAPETEREAIRTQAAHIRADAAQFERVTPHAELRLTIDVNDERRGYLEVDIMPATATATVTLDGARFLDAAESTTDANDSPRRVADGDEIAILATPRDDAEPFRVTATSDDVTIVGEPAMSVRVFSTPNAQTLVAASLPTRVVASAAASDIRDRRSPMLSTMAQSAAVAGGSVQDVASVSALPHAGAQLRFEGFLQPTGATAAVCTDANRVYRSLEETSVQDDGSVPSEKFPVAAAHVGVVYWVATLTTAAGETLRRGVCGDPAETTVISTAPKLPVVSG